MIAIRPDRLPDDDAQLLALDCSFTTDHVYRIVRSKHSFGTGGRNSGTSASRPASEDRASAAREAGTRCVWQETSTFAYLAIQFCRRLGFAICGLDRSLYDPASVDVGEAALFFARAV